MPITSKMHIRGTMSNSNKLESSTDIETRNSDSWESNMPNTVIKSVVTQSVKIISNLWIRSVISKGLKYRFPSNTEVYKCRGIIGRCFKRQHVEPNTVYVWKLSIFNMIDKWISFCSNDPKRVALTPSPSMTRESIKFARESNFNRLCWFPIGSEKVSLNNFFYTESKRSTYPSKI